MPGRRDDLARAYAVLGLSPGCSIAQATRRYKALVRRWHPDGHAGDPQGEAEAAVRLREINLAFALVRERGWPHGAADPSPELVPGRPEREASPAGGRLTEAQRDEIARAVGGDAFFALLSRYLYWGAVLGLSVFLIAQPSRVGRRSDRATAAGVVVLAAAAARWAWRRWVDGRADAGQ